MFDFISKGKEMLSMMMMNLMKIVMKMVKLIMMNSLRSKSGDLDLMNRLTHGVLIEVLY